MTPVIGKPPKTSRSTASTTIIYSPNSGVSPSLTPGGYPDKEAIEPVWFSLEDSQVGMLRGGIGELMA
jgi:hypothetical protein